MPTLVIPGAYMASLHHTVSGQEVVNVIGVTAEGFGAAEAVANTVHSAWVATGGPLKNLSNKVRLEKVKVVDLSSPTGQIFEKVSTDTGGLTAELGPLAACAVVRIGAASRSRSSKGRVFFGPLAEASINADGRTVEPNQVTQYAASFTQFRTQLTAAGFTWAVLSRKNSSATPVAQISVAPVIGIQRRRLT